MPRRRALGRPCDGRFSRPDPARGQPSRFVKDHSWHGKCWYRRQRLTTIRARRRDRRLRILGKILLAFQRRRFRRRFRLQLQLLMFEDRDLLRLAVFHQCEVVLRQVVDDLAALVLHRDVDHYQAGVGCEGWRCASGLLLSLRRGRRSGRWNRRPSPSCRRTTTHAARRQSPSAATAARRHASRPGTRAAASATRTG